MQNTTPVVDRVISTNNKNAQVICNGKTVHLKKDGKRWLQKVTTFNKKKVDGKITKVAEHSYIEWRLTDEN